MRNFSPVIVACCLATGCIMESDHGYYVPPRGAPLCPTSAGYVSTVQVDADVNPPTADPGYGTGVFVEYASGGHWRIRTICDTLVTGQGCTYDLYADVIGGTVSNVLAESPGPNDLAGTLGTATARLGFDTSTEVDSATFDATPGATVRLTMLLGGEYCAGFIFWKQGGAVRNDTGGNPVDLVPATP